LPARDQVGDEGHIRSHRFRVLRKTQEKHYDYPAGLSWDGQVIG
jgi:hypothetical protein